MPRIRRWHPVSHDFVRDPEVQELRRRFGDWTSLLWLEMLSIADRNSGHIKGDPMVLAKWSRIVWVEVAQEVYDECTESERRLCKWSALRARKAFDWMVEKGWIVRTESGFFVRNYAEYHRTREQKKSLEGTQPLPSEPSEPTRPTEPKKDTPPPPKAPPAPSPLEVQVIEFLNTQAGTSWKPGKAYGKELRGRIADGYELEAFEGVIRLKAARWKDDDRYRENLNPTTLFRKANFERYLVEVSHGGSRDNGPGAAPRDRQGRVSSVHVGRALREAAERLEGEARADAAGAQQLPGLEPEGDRPGGGERVGTDPE